MSFILDISTSTPDYCIKKDDVLNFYPKACAASDVESLKHKLSFLHTRTKIEQRYSCVPDFTNQGCELFTEGNYNESLEKRMQIFKEKAVPLASKAIDSLFEKTKITPENVTHLITVSCTGLMAPGLEFLIAEKYKLLHTEKIGLNFLGCYAAMKALKQAHYIAGANPEACILIVCVELCSLHFQASEVDEDIIANLLFADGASAVMMCGEKNRYVENSISLKLEDIGSSYIPDTFNLMTWNLSSTGFRMFLSKYIVAAIKSNIKPVITDFLKISKDEINFWAVHPGGVKIVEAVQEELELKQEHVEDSFKILKEYGNMSSPTILFILKNIFDKIKTAEVYEVKNIFACAFGPGLNIEMIRMSSVNTCVSQKKNPAIDHYAFEV